MRSTDKLAFELDYLYDKRRDKLFDLLTDDYLFKCDNYAVAYNLLQILDKFEMCEHSNVVDDCFWIYSWFVFITCRPEDVDRIKCIAKRIPSSIPANIKILHIDNETGEEVEV